MALKYFDVTGSDPLSSGDDVCLSSNVRYVGIGTTTPAATLEISKEGYQAVGPVMRLTNPAGAASDRARIEFVDQTTLRSYLEWNIITGGKATWNFYDSVSSASRLFINEDGKVGVGTTSPVSKVDINGSLSLPVVFKTANYTLTASDFAVLCNTSGGNFTITLPAASTCKGRLYLIQKRMVSADSYYLTVEPDGTDKIENESSRTVEGRGTAILIMSDGVSDWSVILDRD